MKEIKELEFDKEVLRRIEIMYRFACVKPSIKQEVKLVMIINGKYFAPLLKSKIIILNEFFIKNYKTRISNNFIFLSKYIDK